MQNPSTPQTPGGTTKTFKARIEKPTSQVYAMEIYFTAENIVEAAQYLMDTYGSVGVFSGNVTKLIEVEHG